MFTTTLPHFSQIQPDQIEAELDQILAENRARIAALLTNLTKPSWATLVTPLEELDDKLSHFWSPINHLYAVAQTPELRTAYCACLPKLTTYHTELEQNEQLYQAFKTLADAAEYKQLNTAQQKVIQNQLRDFRLASVHLDSAAKQRYAEIKTQLAQLSTRFEENLLDATEHWNYHTTDITELTGLPPYLLQATQAAAQAKNLTGWLLTLNYSCYGQVMTYAANRDLRRQMYLAYVTRASDQGPDATRFDNSEVMAEILQLRHDLSVLLGFKNYAELSLATKMVKQPQQVIDFLQELIPHARPRAQQELQTLREFAQATDGITELFAWDIAYYSEKLRVQQYGISDEILRPYFPITQVLPGMFQLIERLYNLQVREITDADVWHPDVRFFAIHDNHGQLRGQFYLDLYTRAQKREGAWMDSCQSRRLLTDNNIQTPIAFLTCNFAPGHQGQPALLTHEDVLTLFHEFGHGLHHMLTKINYAAVAGINGVAWDAVELPSQFMEFFVWEQAVLEFISAHAQTNEPLPQQMYQQLHAAKNFHNGLHILRQLEFALFDFRLHLACATSAVQIQQILDEVRATISVMPPPAFNRFQHSFAHIFAGGYAAGYYSYLWADILASDAFAKFKENGIFDAATGQAFLQNILEQGGSRDAMDLFIAFRGRKPTPTAFLQEQGFYDDNLVTTN